MRRICCAIVGCGPANYRWGPDTEALAVCAGGIAARAGFTVVTGGRGGVMEAAARGAKEAGGFTIGILPTDSFGDANSWLDVVLPTGIGYARNVLTALAGDIMVALPGGHGTLQEMSYAFDYKRPILSWDSWSGEALFPGVPLVGRSDVARVEEWVREHAARLACARPCAEQASQS